MPATSTSHVRLRAAVDADIPFLVTLRKLAMGPHRTAAGIPEDDEQVHAMVRKDFSSASVILHQNLPIGLFKATQASSPRSIPQVQLLPEWQRKGIGTELVSRFVADALAQGEAVELSVLKVNPARCMYERLGFKVVSEGTHGFTLRIEA